MNTIETVQALVSALEAKQWPHGDGFDRIEIAAGRELLAQMQAAIGEQVLKRLDPTLDVFAAQSPAPAAPTFDEWWENHGKYNALFKFDHNASPSDRLARANELMSLSWEVARESPAPVAVQPAALRMRNAVFEAGWRLAAKWAKRDDLYHDVTSAAYVRDRDIMLAELDRLIAATTPENRMTEVDHEQADKRARELADKAVRNQFPGEDRRSNRADRCWHDEYWRRFDAFTRGHLQGADHEQR